MLTACIAVPPSLGLILCQMIWGPESSFGILPAIVCMLGNWIENCLGFPFQFPGFVC